MTTTKSIGASSAGSESKTWDQLPWSKIKKLVFRLQMRIAKATRQWKTGKVKALQRILTTSFYAKSLAVKRVTSNMGAKTPGVDGIIWSTKLQKMQAVLSLKRRGYRPLPLRRIYIPKRGSKQKLRPLSIPTMFDRAFQALYRLALEPIAEEKADPNSYGFRRMRSAKDAIEQCFKVLSRKDCAAYIYDGDIKSCFDRISHEWVLRNVPMDKVILRKFLKAKFMEDRNLYPTISGVPQGGIISTTISLITLSGLEKKLKSLFTGSDRVNVVTYADDFIVTASYKEILEEKVIPTIEGFLQERGLEISQEKSRICHIAEGFDFLGFNIRKYRGKLLIKPSKASIKRFLKEIRNTIKVHKAVKTEDVINLLNPKIRGWVNYFRSSVSSKVFALIDHEIFKSMWHWMKRRHPGKSKSWVQGKYFKSLGLDRWQIYAATKTKDGRKYHLHLVKATRFAIRRHIKIMAIAHPFNSKFKDYFKYRDATGKTRNA
jgi:RNA-directed DNA polymerase